MERRFSLLEALRVSFYTLIEHFAFFLALIAAYVGVLFAGSSLIFTVLMTPFYGKFFQKIGTHGIGATRGEFVQAFLQQPTGHMGIAVMIAVLLTLFLNRYLTLGFIKACFELHDHGKSTISTLFSCHRLVVQAFIASMFYWCICFLGSLLFVFPGIYCAIRYGFFNQCIVDKQVGVVESFRLSSTLTKHERLNIFALWFFLLILNGLSLSLFGLSFFVTWPLSALSYVYVYRALSKSLPRSGHKTESTGLPAEGVN